MKGSKFFKICIIVLAAVFIINQLVSSLYMPIKTESAIAIFFVDFFITDSCYLFFF